MRPLLLSRDEIESLTGYKRPAQQCEWLRTRGWVFEQDANRRPIVGRNHADARLGFASAPEGAARSTIRPNFEALARR